MRIRFWNPRAVWETTKRVLTRNLWLKVLSLLLAIGTYSALKDKSQDEDVPVNSEAAEAEFFDNLKKYMSRTNSEQVKKQPAAEPEKKASPNTGNKQTQSEKPKEPLKNK